MFRTIDIIFVAFVEVTFGRFSDVKPKALE